MSRSDEALKSRRMGMFPKLALWALRDVRVVERFEAQTGRISCERAGNCWLGRRAADLGGAAEATLDGQPKSTAFYRAPTDRAERGHTRWTTWREACACGASMGLARV